MYKIWYCNSEEFIKWCKANGYKEGLEIDRKNNDKGYIPSNCRFVTKLVNMNNRRVSKNIVIHSENLTFSDAVRKHGKVSYDTAKNRVVRGWDVTDAICKPYTTPKNQDDLEA